MRILYLGNNLVGWKSVQYLHRNQDEIVGLVLAPAEKQRYASEIVAAVGPGVPCFDGSGLRDAEVIAQVRDLHPDIAVSCFFTDILRRDFLDLFPQGCVNVHPAYLPYNRGAYPNVWAIVEGTPAGVTIHYIDDGIDTGDVISRREVPVEPFDTGRTLYEKLESTALELFAAEWPRIARGDVSRCKQAPEQGSFHRSADVAEIDEIDLDRPYRAGDLINILRARTFAPFDGAYFVDEHGRKVFLRLEPYLSSNKGEDQS